MLRIDQGDFLKLMYQNSADLQRIYEYDENEYYGKTDYKFGKGARSFQNQLFQEFQYSKAVDLFTFEEEKTHSIDYLNHEEQYIKYPRKLQLQQAINKVIDFQDQNQLIDYHPNTQFINLQSKYFDEIISGKNKDHLKYKKQNSQDENEFTNLNQKFIEQIQNEMITIDTQSKNIEEKLPIVRNIIHQSLQSYHKEYCTTQKDDLIQQNFEKYNKKSQLKYDQWGKKNTCSNSQFMWLPVQFEIDRNDFIYKIQGKLFEHLEQFSEINELKLELSHLMTYFSQHLYTTHEYFKSLNYDILRYGYKTGNEQIKVHDNKSKVDFDEKIHAIVKITEMVIKPYSVYNGSWHAEGYSSDNILYTCLYVIEQDPELINGKLVFKRGPRYEDTPESQQQDAHQYCPGGQSIYDSQQLIPIGNLDLKEDLMIIFPNQNIHRVQEITNPTNKPLKRKIIALFVVNHEDQPITINDVKFTEPVEYIKEKRLVDIYERSKNKASEFQEYCYCEH